MKKTIVAFRELGALDYILPLVMELHGVGLVQNPQFIASSGRSFDVCRKNKILMGGIEHIGGTFTCLSYYRSRVINQFRNLWVLRDCLFGPVNLFEVWDINVLVYELLAKYNRLFYRDGKRLKAMLLPSPARAIKNHHDYIRLVRSQT